MSPAPASPRKLGIVSSAWPLAFSAVAKPQCEELPTCVRCQIFQTATMRNRNGQARGWAGCFGGGTNLQDSRTRPSDRLCQPDRRDMETFLGTAMTVSAQKRGFESDARPAVVCRRLARGLLL